MSSLPSIVDCGDPASFLERCGPWLQREEARYNLMLGLASARAEAGSWEEGAAFLSVEADGEVVGCVMRTPPHKLLITDMPMSAVEPLVEAVLLRYPTIPAVLGTRPVAEAIAGSWVRRRGGRWQLGMRQGVYKLTHVIQPNPRSPGGIAPADVEDVPLAVHWGVAFARETGVGFPPGPDAVAAWIDRGRLFLWCVDDVPVSMAVAHGFTGSGVRIGYVYTPPERRGRGYASALVAALSQQQLDEGRAYCVLYTDLGNATSNSIYQNVGYEFIEEVVDVLIEPETG